MGKFMLNGKEYGGSGDTASNITYDSTASGNGASTVQSAIDINSEKIDTLNESLFDLIYPVGSIYMSINSTDPSTLFGGTWERIKDTFLLAAGNTYAGGSVGGEATHTLTVDEMPSHYHNVNYDWEDSTGKLTDGWGYVISKTSTGISGGERMQSTGGSQAHNNMPPYLTVFVWKRTA